jgi:two-component system, NtrC family, sensor kinase
LRSIGLRAKVGLFVGCLVVVIIAINAVITLRTERHERERQLLEQGKLFARLTVTDVVRAYGSTPRVPGGTGQAGLSFRMERFFRDYPDLVRLTILSEGGRVLYDSAAAGSDEGKVVHTNEQELIDRLSTTSMDVREAVGKDGERLMDILVPVGESGPQFIKVRYLISYQSMEKRLADIRHEFLLLAGFFILAGILVASVFSARLTSPVLKLKEGAGEIARGNMDHEVETSGTDEIAELGRSFNLMARSLKEHRLSLERANRNLILANEELHRLQKELIRSERMAAVGQLAAGLSHEIDNPIGIILGFAELMYEDFPEEDPRREDLATIIQESRRCKRIVRGLLDFSRPPALGVVPTDVNEVVSDTVQSAVSQRMFKNITVELSLADGMPRIPADPDRLRQVFMNLLINAAQAMPDGGRVEVITGFELDARAVTVVFEDDGPGIPPGDIDRIFEPFYTTKRPGEGTGLGLAICQRLLEEQGGTIGAESGPEKGARFTVTLPSNKPYGPGDEPDASENA